MVKQLSQSRREDPGFALSAARVNAFVALEHALSSRRLRKAATARKRLEALGVLVEVLPAAEEVAHGR